MSGLISTLILLLLACIGVCIILGVIAGIRRGSFSTLDRTLLCGISLLKLDPKPLLNELDEQKVRDRAVVGRVVELLKPLEVVARATGLEAGFKLELMSNLSDYALERDQQRLVASDGVVNSRLQSLQEVVESILDFGAVNMHSHDGEWIRVTKWDGETHEDRGKLITEMQEYSSRFLNAYVELVSACRKRLLL